MNRLTLLLASTTCRLSDVMKLIRQQEALIEALQVQGRPTASAEALLAIFMEAAATFREQKESLEAQIVDLFSVPEQKADARPECCSLAMSRLITTAG